MIYEDTSRNVAIRTVPPVKLLVHVAKLFDNLTGGIGHASVRLDCEIREEVIERLGQMSADLDASDRNGGVYHYLFPGLNLQIHAVCANFPAYFL